jgi:ribulose-5-phosphate 4-epimerase/fuculose-1-phosphate aldolase
MAEADMFSGAATEKQLRRDLAAAYRLIAHFGWDDLIFTHISVRIPGPDHHFLINPFGHMFAEITASSLVKIDLDGNVIDSNSGMINAAGFTIHSAIHAAREDAYCVIHLHTVAGVAVSSQEQGLLPLNQTSMLLNGAVAYHDFEGVAFDLDERPRLVANLGEKPIMILRNHGTLAVGSTVADAFLRIYLLETACAMQIAAQGAVLRIPAGDVQAKVQNQARSDKAGISNQLVWPALLRLLDRTNPGYGE